MSIQKILIWIVIFIGLYISKTYNYLLFHTLVELFSIVIAYGIFIFGWNSREYLKNNYLLFISIAYLFIASFDLIHTLSYRGIGIIPEEGGDIAVQIWVITRLIEAVSFLVAFAFINRKFNINLTVTIYSIIFIGAIYSVFGLGIFPSCYIPNEGLTTFKVSLEYIISLILLINLWLLHRHKTLFNLKVKKLPG